MIKQGLIQVRAFPFSEHVQSFIQSYAKVLVIEQNREGQMRKLLLSESVGESQQLISVLFYKGMPIEASDLVERLKQIFQG